MARPGKSRLRALGWGALALGIIAVLGIGLSAVMFSRWSEVRTLSAEEADREFTAEIVRAGGGRAYLELEADGTVRANRDMEGSKPRSLAALHLLAWDPERRTLLRIAFPMWFVQVKMSRALNLGTITSALARDWRNLDLTVSVEELERSGPGIVLDHRREDGAHILLWTEAAPGE
jgi:hypothetical protein